MPQLTADQIKQALHAGVTPQQIESYINTGKANSSYQSQKPKSFLHNVAEGIVRSFAEVGVGLVNAGRSAASVAKGENKDYPRRTYDLPFLGETKPFMTRDENLAEFTKKTVGYGLDMGSNLSELVQFPTWLKEE